MRHGGTVDQSFVRPRAGDVFVLPPEARSGGDPKWRYHVLLNDCADPDGILTFAYASTQPTEAIWGAANVLVDPARKSYTASGFQYPTYVYPSRLVPALAANVGEPVGRLGDEMPAVREQLRVALGMGTGVASGTGRAARTFRGLVVRFAPPLTEEIGAILGVVATDPDYSLQEREQLVIPILGNDDVTSESILDVYIEGPAAKAIAGFDHSLGSPYLWTDNVLGVHHRDEIEVVGGLCVDDRTMADLEKALMIRFQL